MFHDPEIMCLELHMIPISVFYYTENHSAMQVVFVKKSSAFFLLLLRKRKEDGKACSLSKTAADRNFSAAAV